MFRERKRGKQWRLGDGKSVAAKLERDEKMRRREKRLGEIRVWVWVWVWVLGSLQFSL